MKVCKQLLGALIAAGVVALPAQAQVVREEGVSSIAGVLYTAAGAPAHAEWTFKSAGGEILFASLDADIYRESVEHEEGVTTAADDGCSGGEDEDGCEDDGGPGLFRLAVADAYGNTLCAAVRPAPPPGWMRDPRLACVLPPTGAPATYRVKVELRVPADHMVQPAYPFLLNLSLRKAAPSGTNVQSAIATSRSAGF